MKCPFCGSLDSKVIDSRSSDEKKRRRRECTECHKRFTTYETVETPLLSVRKRDGTYQLYDRNKLIKGIYTAIKKRPKKERLKAKTTGFTVVSAINGE